MITQRIRKIGALVLSVLMLAVFMLTGTVNEAASGGARTGSMVTLTGYGGAEYYKKTNYYVNIYGANGQIAEVRLRSGGSRQKMYVLTDSASGTQQYAYCLASGMSFYSSADFTAGGEGSAFSSYFSDLPETARQGIAYASIYGYSDKNGAPDAPGPVSGTLGVVFRTRYSVFVAGVNSFEQVAERFSGQFGKFAGNQSALVITSFGVPLFAYRDARDNIDIIIPAVIREESMHYH